MLTNRISIRTDKSTMREWGWKNGIYRTYGTIWTPWEDERHRFDNIRRCLLGACRSFWKIFIWTQRDDTTVAGKCAPDHCGIDPSVHSSCKTEKRYFPHMEESKTCDPDDVVWYDRYCGLPDDILYGSRWFKCRYRNSIAVCGTGYHHAVHIACQPEIAGSIRAYCTGSCIWRSHTDRNARRSDTAYSVQNNSVSWTCICACDRIL